MAETEARRMEVRIPPDREFRVALTGAQLRFLLGVVNEHVFRGERAFFVAEVIGALQRPVLEGVAETDNGREE